MFFSVLFFLTITLSTVSAAPSPTSTGFKPTFNPREEDLILPSRSRLAIPQSFTNAQRLKAGLPLKAPRRFHSRDDYGSSPPGYPYPPYPVPSNHPGHQTRGFIQVSESSTGNVIGFVGNTFVIDGEYGIIPPSTPQEQRLLVNVNRATRGPQSIQTSNGPDDKFPYLGSILGFGSPSGDLSPGSFSYTYIGGTSKPTPPGSKPQAQANSFTMDTGIDREIESAVFTLHHDDSITIQWVNEDPSVNNCFNHIGVIASNILFATGDKDQFTRVFGATTWVDFKFIPIY
ncbi:hypothetical protein K435DRAFT_773288 [Dendrothele bispora CBS 962.96]|uniref:Uncharacterized protein n=1 Tax=Dendrothele bispora (strain CBS 962.96) TaxID=1314807 RepID=A0A4S8MT04_DENBC|nr:hypothetical protein K435DRAFT_773288 [Dendrothele bispora CBS 962.96]